MSQPCSATLFFIFLLQKMEAVLKQGSNTAKN
jgi:hypothetical protein